VLREPLIAVPAPPEIKRELVGQIPESGSQAMVLTGVRRCGKSTLLTQLMRRQGSATYCNFEDIRLFGMGPQDFPAFLSVLEGLSARKAPLFLDEVQEVPHWQRLVRTLLDRGWSVVVTGSNASLLGRELGSKLTGRHLSFEVFPFSYREYLMYTKQPPGADVLDRLS